jgi:uncharacterized repeat protein (TIGR03803 family)
MKQLRSAALLLGALCLLVASPSLHAGVVLTNIFSFNGTNGSLPTVLVRAGNNKFYGITARGGPNYAGPFQEYGGVYSITSDGVFSNLCFFENTNGSYGAYLTPEPDGNIYGTTLDTIFKLNPDGTMANPHLAAFGGYMLSVGMLQDRDGTLYGTIENGGPSNIGTIYKIDTNGVFSTLVKFDGTNGAIPTTLLLGADNNFYGIAGNETGAGDGVIFRVDRSGNLTDIFHFSDPNAVPNRMVQGSDGDLYVISSGGPALNDPNDPGSVFRITTNGVLAWSFSFNGTNGYGATWITAGNDGNFYGLTGYGGSNYDGTPNSGFGTIFRITPSGSFTSLFQFDGTNDSGPSTIIQGTDGNLYGTREGGGTYGVGAIFKLSLPSCPTNRLMLTTVATNFSENPVIMQGNDGMLYGTSDYDGAFGLGTIFRSTLSGSVTTLVSFNGTNGADPQAPPLQAADGNFYGTTYAGGSNWSPPTNSSDFGNYGTVYRMDSNGVLTTIFSFSGTNGMGPESIGGLIVGNDGALYGVTENGGGPDTTNSYDGDGTIFKITTNGDFTLLASFNGSNGLFPVDLIQASDGNFYGTTRGGGIIDTPGFGTIFQMTSGGQINTLVRFNGTNGAWPLSIMQASDGCLYGTTEEGGAFYAGGASSNPGGYGTVFKITTNGNFTLLASFDTTNGALPSSKLIEICPGVFYGIAINGGLYPFGLGYEYNSGTFFRVTTNGDLTGLLSFGANSLLPAVPLGNLIKASNGNFYGGAQGAIYNNVEYPTAIFSVRPVQAPVLQPVAQTGQLNLNWNAWAGYSYNVMYETNLTGSNWNILSTVAPQTNGIASYSDLIGPDTQRFYRVVLQLP